MRPTTVGDRGVPCALARESPGTNALLNPRPLEPAMEPSTFGPAPSGGAGATPRRGHERNAPRLPIVEQHDQVAEVPAETIEPPAHDALHSVAPHVSDELVERGAAVFRTRDAVVDDDAAQPRGNVAAQLEERSRVLVGRATAHNATCNYFPSVRFERPRMAARRDRLHVDPFFRSHACSARSTCTESGTPPRSLRRRAPSMTSRSIRKAVSSFGDMHHLYKHVIRVVKILTLGSERRYKRAPRGTA